MNIAEPTNHLVASTLLAGLTTAMIVSCFRYFDIPSGHLANTATQILVPIVVAAALLLTRPLLLRTLLRDRRSPFLLDEDLNAMLIGRALGLIGGACIGITLYTEFI
jgi:hypothetical protein